MRLWIVSDLHIELTHGWDLLRDSDPPDFDVMVVAGDLISKMERGVSWLRERVQDRPVIYVAGNHEFYGVDIDRTVEKARHAAAGTNIHVMQNDTVLINDVRFIAMTLWTDFAAFGNPEIAMQAAANYMNDYQRIRKSNYAQRLRPLDTLKRHQDSRAYLESELSKPHRGPTVVVTHHGPDLASARPGHERDILTAAYVSDLSDLIIRTAPTLWIYGHTHCSDDRILGSTRIVSNAKGYGLWVGHSTCDNPLFDPRFVATV